jgi:hypothetical protein
MNDDLASMIRIGEYATEYVATVASLSPFEVTFRGERMSAVNGMPNHCHVIGDPVRVIRSDQQLVVTSTAAKLPVLAVVSAYAGGTANCAVVAGDDTFDAQILGSGWTPAVGDRVAILWTSAGPFALKRGGPVASPADPPTPPDNMNVTTGSDVPAPPPPPSGSITVTVLAKQTAVYNWSTGAIYTGDQARYWLYSGYRTPTTGPIYDSYWFYGDGLNLVAGATVTKVELYVVRASGVGPSTATTFYFRPHANKTKPSTEPAHVFPSPDVTSTSLAPGQGKWITLPLVWGQDMASTAAFTAKGVGLITEVEEPYKALLGIDHPDPAKRNPQSGALRITYKRS